MTPAKTECSESSPAVIVRPTQIRTFARTSHRGLAKEHQEMRNSPDSAVEELNVEECWDLLGSVDLGRLAVATDHGVDIFPMNYLVKDRMIYLRSAPGSKLVDITERPSVAFEADGIHRRRRWSVVVKGNAKRLGFDAEIEESGVLELRSQNPTEKWNYIRISPESVTGRRFTSERHSQ